MAISIPKQVLNQMRNDAFVAHDGMSELVTLARNFKIAADEFNLKDIIDTVLVDKPSTDASGKVLRDTKTHRPIIKGKDTAWGQYRQLAQRGMYGDAAYFLDPDEVRYLEKQILEVMYFEPTLDEIVATLNIGAGKSEYKYYKNIKPLPPEITNDFEGGTNVKVLKESATKKLIGLHYDWHLTKPELDASRANNGIISLSPSPEMNLLQELTAALQQYRCWFGFLGGDIPNINDGNNNGLTGLLNDSSLTFAGLSDTNLTTIGDVEIAAKKLAAWLIQKKFKPPFVLDMSPGVLIQALTNINATSSKTDYQLILELASGVNAGRMFSKIRMNPFMINSETETNSTGAIAAYAVSPRNFRLIESYPLSFYPTPPTTLGINGKLLWMGNTVIQRPDSIAFDNGITTNSFAA